MTTYLPKEVQDGLDAARLQAKRRKSRLRVETGAQSFAVLRSWEGGFALPSDGGPHLRGLVDLYDGTRHLSRCLIVASEEEAGERRYDLKLVNQTGGSQPVDFERLEDLPVALIGRV
ncbi:hypothetical protein [Roseovarius aestuariivivens]|uniref:hypothetical protein n=1 Tax=Roseovarius aestuariivivens TaxID=1888910 RepID=UPI00108036CD|nr:hypothetical protein [Roseovarius aestuariivivens]